jgi:hypothetical protein
MNKDVLNKSMLAPARILVAASMAFAKSSGLGSGRSSKKSADVDIAQTGRIPGGPTLQSGEHKVALINNSSTPEIEFYYDGELFARFPQSRLTRARGSTKPKSTTIQGELTPG